MKLSHFKNKFIILRCNFYYLKIALNCIGIKDKRLCRNKLGMKIASIINFRVNLILFPIKLKLYY